MTFILCFLWK